MVSLGTSFSLFSAAPRHMFIGVRVAALDEKTLLLRNPWPGSFIALFFFLIRCIEVPGIIRFLFELRNYVVT